MPAKIWVPLLLIVGGVSWLAMSNLNSANYFYDLEELTALGDEAYERTLKVKGRVTPGSIKADQRPIAFTIAENDQSLDVLYVGEEPLPDLFRDRADAVVEGTIRPDGVFEAVHVQAKCASKYEAGPPTAEDGQDAGSYPEYQETEPQRQDNRS